jgi:hypothetical protein
MSNHEIVCDDVIHWAKTYTGGPFMAMICDPPYHLGPKGFMNRAWDAARYGIAFKAETWAALAEHLLPGAFGMAFASSRGWHRLAVAIEDSGLRIHPSIFCWAQGQGFCKATNIHAQLEKRLCYQDEDKNWFYESNSEPMRTKPPFRHSLADRFYGHRYGGQALAPKVEPIIVFQKPYAGKPVNSITGTGAGALWIDGGRIGYPLGGRPSDSCWSEKAKRGDKSGSSIYGVYGDEGQPTIAEKEHPQGRWPANFCLTHSVRCIRIGEKRVKSGGGSDRLGYTVREDESYTKTGVHGIYSQFEKPIMTGGYADPDGLETIAAWDCHESCPVRRLGEQSGERRTGGLHKDSLGGTPQNTIYNQGWVRTGNKEGVANSKGTAARFFHQSDWSYEIAERLAMADPVRYVAKASRKERDAGLKEWAEREVPFSEYRDNYRNTKNFVIHYPDGSPRPVNKLRNPHPTVKPITLTRWLATLLLPPAEYAPRRLLVPFCGTGSEMIGAGLVGWEHILGIEMDADTVAIAEARLRHWLGKPRQLELGNA